MVTLGSVSATAALARAVIREWINRPEGVGQKVTLRNRFEAL